MVRVRVRVRRNLPHAQRATAFHFLISKRLGFLVEGPALLEGSPAGTMGTSESRVAIGECEQRNQEVFELRAMKERDSRNKGFGFILAKERAKSKRERCGLK